MGIYSVGVDLVEIRRVGELIERYGERFLERVFTAREIAYCSRKKGNYESFAGRFAAKEALFKAVGSGLSDGMRWQDVEVGNDARGKPHVRLSGRTAELLEGKTVHLSISHSRHHALAMVVVERQAEPPGINPSGAQTGKSGI